MGMFEFSQMINSALVAKKYSSQLSCRPKNFCQKCLSTLKNSILSRPPACSYSQIISKLLLQHFLLLKTLVDRPVCPTFATLLLINYVKNKVIFFFEKYIKYLLFQRDKTFLKSFYFVQYRRARQQNVLYFFFLLRKRLLGKK